MIWCEHCRDHYDINHYTADGREHLTGAEYGPTGEDMAALRAERATVQPKETRR